jgi:hypothetical protein
MLNEQPRRRAVGSSCREELFGVRRFIAALRPLAAFEKAAKRLESGDESSFF